ncbi:hypothetical protein CBS147345_6564 [Aspergillus niger]|nr:hypothetical protein CBS147345_6564 [Aspergillus niger]
MTSIKALANTQDIIVGDASLQRTILNDLYNGSRYKETGSVEDLTDTINFRGTLLPRIRPMYKPDAVLGMARWLVLRFEKDEQLYLGDLKSAINMVDALLSAGVPHPFSPAQLLVQVGEWTHKLYDCDQDLGTLEASRGLVAGLFLDARTDLSGLRREHPELAKEFGKIGAELNRDSSNIQRRFKFGAQNEIIMQDNIELNRGIQLQREFDDLVETIREKNWIL